MWKEISKETPPKDKVIMTKIHDEHGSRNKQELVWDGNLWWFPDKSMYVYYQPTHWKTYIENQNCEEG